jgi:hypothetical protein
MKNYKSDSKIVVGTAGAKGQMHNHGRIWICLACKQENYANYFKCERCRGKKPATTSNDYEKNEVNLTGKSQTLSRDVSLWKEVVDPSSYQIYYYNATSGHTQWERPSELGDAPIATGWFGRGGKDSTAAQLFVEENARYLGRSARQQKEYVDQTSYHTEGSNEYNIWYGRYQGDRDFGKKREPSTARCILASDAGATKADNKSRNGDKSSKYFCLHFARGLCMNGNDCTYYHRVPIPRDDAEVDELFDCFGRKRHKEHRDDMDGTGSFVNPCRTLYVGGLLKEKYKSKEDLEDAVWRHFGEWGELENVNVVHHLSVAFPRYRLRTSAEFAKEAMAQQSLEHGEILNVKWAHDDPNPVAKKAIEKANRDAVFSILRARGIDVRSLNDPKRENLYPDTDAQFKQQQLRSLQNAHIPSMLISRNTDWDEYIDPETGAIFFYNSLKKESSWGTEEEREIN